MTRVRRCRSDASPLRGHAHPALRLRRWSRGPVAGRDAAPRAIAETLRRVLRRPLSFAHPRDPISDGQRRPAARTCPPTMRNAAQCQMPSAIEAVGEREAQQHQHQAADERRDRRAARRRCRARLHVVLELQLGQVELIPDQLRDVLDGQRNQIAHGLIVGAARWTVADRGLRPSALSLCQVSQSKSCLYPMAAGAASANWLRACRPARIRPLTQVITLSKKYVKETANSSNSLVALVQTANGAP